MNDYDEQLLGGTPDLTEEQRQAILAEQQAIQATLDQLEPPQPVAETAEVTTPQPQQTKPQESPSATKKTEVDLDKIGAEFDTMALVGLADFGADLLNMIPNVNIPKAPKFENEIAQSVRELTSIVIPTMAIGAGGGAALTRAASGSKFLSDPLVRHLGTTAFSAGAGAFVDYTVEINQEDDNLAGSLRKNLPRWFGWIPEDVATLDGDSPEVKRNKNVLEGTYLGVGTDVVLGLNKLIKGTRGVNRATQWVPESEKAGTYFKNNVVSEGTPEEIVEASAAARSDALDEIGNYNLSKTAVDVEVPVTGKDYYIENMASRAEGVDIDEARQLYSDAWDSMDDATKAEWDKFAVDNPTTQIQRTYDIQEPLFGYHDLYGYQEQGIRSIDPLGIVGASVDAARISGNVESIYGRIGNSMSEGALKFGLETTENQDMIIRGLTDQLKEADRYGYTTAGGRYISHNQILESGENLAANFYKADITDIKGTISDFADVNLDSSVKKYVDRYFDMDYMRTQAYVGTSVAGQISDMAQGMRLVDGTPAIERSQEQIIDRIQFLMNQTKTAEYVRDRVFEMRKLWKRITNAGGSTKALEEIAANQNLVTADVVANIGKESKITADTLRAIKEEQPEMLGPLMLAYELTDGNVDTISKLNNYVQQSLGVFNKALIDRQPEIPSVVMRGFYANLYNSTLSAFGTPIKAGLSNAALLIEKPFRSLVGAGLTGDKQTIRRSIYQYNSMAETLQDSFSYMKEIFKRSGTDPYVVAARDDLGLKNERQLEILNAFANAKAEQGEYGAQAMLDVVNNMNALANHPWLRFGNRSMQALDGFTQSMVATFEAKGRAFDEVTKGGKLEFDGKRADALYKKVRSGMFDKNGIITDDAVKYASGEISLNLDNAANNALSEFMKSAPILKPFLLFTKTPLNEVALAASYNPLGIFVRDLNSFSAKFEDMPLDKVEELLTSRGIEVTPYNIKAKYNEIRADLMGRKALGALYVSGAVSLFMSDNLTGNGHYNRQVQALRRDADWKPRSIRVPGGNWVSYDNLGPVTNFLALTADIMDNFDTLSPSDVGENLKKMGYIFGASITDKTMLSGLEPFMDVARGDVGSINKWASSFLTSAVVPGSSQLAEISRLMDPALKEVEMNVFSLVTNRLPLSKSQLPAKYDWIDGGEVGIPDNFMSRVWNTYMPWKVNGKISPEKQFLIDIEYDARPTLRTNGKGVELTSDERSEITSIMGRDGLFKAGIQRVMKTKEAKQFRSNYKKAVDAGLEPDVSEFESLHILLDNELRAAMRSASAQAPSRDSISRKMYIQEVVGDYLKNGNQAAAERFLDYMENFSK